MHFCDISSDSPFVQKSDVPTPLLTQKHMEKINWNPKIQLGCMRDIEDVLWASGAPIKDLKPISRTQVKAVSIIRSCCLT